MSKLYTVKCDPPDEIDLTNSLTVLDYKHPTLVNSTVNVSCITTSQFQTTLTCMSDGQWEPHPNNLSCKGKNLLINYIISIDSMLYRTF